MAIYVTSDLHGLSVEDLEALLEKAGFTDADWLYLLGDVIDRRGDGGVGILKWLLTSPNAQLLLGNHEAMLLSCDFLFQEVTGESIDALSAEKMELLQLWLENGGEVTLAALREVRKKDPELLLDLLDYLRECPLYETAHAGGRDFVLVHSGLQNFRPDKKLSDYTAEELLWANPARSDEYFTDVVTVFGHTPTLSFGPEWQGKIFATSTWIDVDTGAGFGYAPALLRLDDLQEYYL